MNATIDRLTAWSRCGRLLGVLLVTTCGPLESAALALDKQGSAHGGGVSGADEGFDLTGALTVGVSIINNSYAARPNNTGLALMRYAGHADVDLIGRRLSIPVDVNMFTDKLRPGFEKLAPTELDLILGVTSTWTLAFGALESGTRIEHDRPLDQGGLTQTYIDLRERYLYSLAQRYPRLRDIFRDGDVSGWVTLGWFAVNPSYYARPDNTGRALFRYGANARLSTFSDLFAVAFDVTMYTDRFATVPIRPSELDFTPEVIVRRGVWEAHLAYETDRSVDRGGFKQQFVYALLVWSFDAYNPDPVPFERDEHVPTP